jgi:transcriptional regulator with XRE-family HTH domain
MTDTKSVQDAPIVSHDRVVDAVRAQLHAAIVVQRRFTVQQLHEHSGVAKTTIESYMRNDGAKEPSLSRALSLAAVLGPCAVQSIVGLIGYSATPNEDPDALQPMQIVADALGHLGVIGQAAADGRIDHTEQPRTTEAADMLIATVLPLSSAGRGGR